MSRYSIGWVSPAPLTGAPYMAFRAPTSHAKLLEIGFGNNAATASNVSLFRNTNGSYAASTSTSVGQPEAPGTVAATGLCDTAWSAAPTITAASRMRRFILPATIGAGLIWTFQNGLWVRSGTATDILVLWNEGGSTASVLNGYCLWEE